MYRSFAVAGLVSAAALGLAPSASADEAGYLELRETLAFLTEDQLLSAGHAVCQATRSGVPASDIVDIVLDELQPYGVTVSSATHIVVTAITELGC
ncbi:DUF732 domain-containing protein [Mycobacterium sp. PS03-16]|uniref:DUF732 domain-containing protein n=1 Tax=Mycobacterium sp. PS03-16 TaxID=2559611 RepID=UPI00142F6216|nr:DUF732 domain-containing protein [Mycobacterium sp. PS03-16]